MLLRATRAQRNVLIQSSRRFASAAEETIERPDQPPPVELDESYQRLLDDVNLSIERYEKRNIGSAILQDEAEADMGSSEPLKSTQWKRKSPAARFGSDRIGQFKLPFELVTSMQLLVDNSDKYQLRSDAKRLLAVPTKAKGNNLRWIADTPKYSTGKEERMRGPREGLAYAAITLPGQVAAIRAVLHEVRTRLPRKWSENVKNILDFGSQTGAGFWSTLTFFGKQPDGWEHQDILLNETTLKRYIGFDNRKGLVSLARKIEPDKPTGDCVISHHQFYRDLDEYDLNNLQADDGASTLAISAFVLSQLPTPANKKQIVKEMWNSSAEVIIIVDQGTKDGFNAVADARDYLLKLASEDDGAHVVAPCPHDGVCPLRATPDTCGFTQRFLRPEFQKKTKHVKRSYEDIKYSYVVIRRGKRPERPKAIEAPVVVGDAVLSSDSRVPMTAEEKLPETSQLNSAESDHVGVELVDPEPLREDDKGEYPDPGDTLSLETERQEVERKYRVDAADSALQEHLRLSSYRWRRTIYPPMKGSRHVTLDCCTPKGDIARIVIPRSQGKQEYYDARKAEWGDLFPHEPRNGEVIRKRGIRRLESISSTSSPLELPKEDMEELQKLLSGTTKGAFAQREHERMPRMDKNDRRENHRRRKAWRNQEEKGYR